MKKSFKFLMASLILIAGLGVGIRIVNANSTAASSDFTDFWTIKGIGSLANTAIAWIGNGRNFHLYDGDIILGGKGNKPSATLGEYPGYKVQIKNCGTTTWALGTVVVSTASAGDGCGQAGTSATLGFLGIADGAVTVGSIGSITTGGWALALTTGTVNRGDILISTSVSTGYASVNNTPTLQTVIGIVVTSGTLPSGTVVVRMK